MPGTPPYPNDQGQPTAATPVYQTAHASVLCQTASRVLKATAGTVGAVMVLSAGAATGFLYDCASTAATLPTGNLVAYIPPTLGSLVLNFPCLIGITLVPGAGQLLSVSYD